MSPVARRDDPQTSWDAARSIDSLTARQEAVLAELRTWGPQTDEQLVARIRDQSPSGVRTRRSELVERGLVQDSGHRERSSSGRQMIVWKATDAPAVPAEQMTAFDL